jgi:hypothetical protein
VPTPDHRLRRHLTNYKVAIAAAAAAVLGGLCLWGAAMTSGVASSFLGGVGATVFSIGVVVLVYELWLRRSIVSEFLAASNLGVDIDAAGVRAIGPFESIDWNEFFDEHPGDVDLVFGYGRTWSISHAAQVIRAASGVKGRVVVTVLDPDPGNQVALDFYGDVYGESGTEVQGRINEVVKVWKEAASRCEGSLNLSVQGIRRHMPFTIYRSGDYMWLVLAPRQQGRLDFIPAILCRKASSASRGLYDWAMADLEACRRAEDKSTRVIWEEAR